MGEAFVMCWASMAAYDARTRGAFHGDGESGSLNVSMDHRIRNM